jgi:hypothetical protein
MHEGTLVAVLAIYATSEGAFTDDHGRLLDLLAPKLAASLAYTKGSPREVLHDGFSTGGSPRRVLHGGFSTKGSARRVLHEGFCTEGSARRVLHGGFCTEGSAPRVLKSWT